jgi:hypothetical protein
MLAEIEACGGANENSILVVCSLNGGYQAQG